MRTTVARTGSVEVPAPDDCRSKDGSRDADFQLWLLPINPCLWRPQKSEHRLCRQFSPTYILPTRFLRFLYSKTYLGARYAGPLFNIQYSAVHDSVQVGVDKLGSNLCTSTSYTNVRYPTCLRTEFDSKRTQLAPSTPNRIRASKSRTDSPTTSQSAAPTNPDPLD